MKKAFSLLFLLVFLCFSYSFISETLPNHSNHSSNTELTTTRLNSQVKSLKAFLVNNPKYNQEIAFFIDMKVLSGRNRFFIYDFQKKEVIDKGLVAHGSGSETGVAGELKFSNTDNSYATSLGKYAVGEKYNGKFGTAYKLTGLDKTNSNARDRNIVLHKYDAVPYDEQLNPIVNSLGCPMVNKVYFGRIEAFVDNSEKNILLTIYY